MRISRKKFRTFFAIFVSRPSVFRQESYARQFLTSKNGHTTFRRRLKTNLMQ